MPRIVDLVRAWRGPVAFSRFFNRPESSYERLIEWTKFQGPPETDLVDELKPYATDVIDKHTYSFFGEEGRALAAAQGWTDVYVCGIDADIWVLKTAVGAFELGLTPHVITDASASHAGPRAQEAGLYLLGRFIGTGQLITTDDLEPRLRANQTAAAARRPDTLLTPLHRCCASQPRSPSAGPVSSLLVIVTADLEAPWRDLEVAAVAHVRAWAAGAEIETRRGMEPERTVSGIRKGHSVSPTTGVLASRYPPPRTVMTSCGRPSR